MTDRVYLMTEKALKENAPKEFEVTIADDKLAGFLLRFEGKVYAYLNHCPHLGIPLNWQPDAFMSLEETHIQCSTHGALFNPDNGLCISGPCRGQSLTLLNIETDTAGDIYLVRPQAA
ncbi:Rieske (2Fe-2S) protein [Methylophaga sp. OBS3]|uniref:Rieske (2Fe-2S) protein n=1 Tax=Methylophaga sp. OBS3 TaxID=2991934 RepID=UPI0022589E89|nr:Rieske 2Fe-2S domain-containing protein [Methylophaga sp. OBS3]MCX4190694.1 Rieske 2Fe-2S domain-containing protein [Methylophaga sp. OBS3]